MEIKQEDIGEYPAYKDCAGMKNEIAADKITAEELLIKDEDEGTVDHQM